MNDTQADIVLFGVADASDSRERGGGIKAGGGGGEKRGR